MIARSALPLPLRYITLAGLLWALWLGFTSSIDPQEMAVGAVVAALVALLGVRLFPADRCFFLHPRRLLYLLIYAPKLLWAIVLANIDVAGRVLSPQLKIKPGIVRVKTRLQSPIGRMLLANSITLTPGTLTVDIEDDELFIHWIDVKTEDIETTTREIVAEFEKYLEVIFG